MPRAAPSIFGRGDVVRIGAHAEAGQFAVDSGTARLGVFELLQNQHAGTFAQHEAVAILVPGTARGRRIVVARRERRAAENPPIPSGEMVASAPPATITSASPYSIRRAAVADAMHASRARRDHRQARALEAVHDREIARDHVDDRAGDEERRDAARPALGALGWCFLDHRQATDARADVQADALGVLRRLASIPESLQRFHRGGNSVMNETVHAPRFFRRAARRRRRNSLPRRRSGTRKGGVEPGDARQCRTSPPGGWPRHSLTLLPTGQTIPRPVTTTRRLDNSTPDNRRKEGVIS